MTFEGIAVIVILVTAMVMFITEILPVDLVAIMIIVALVVTGVLTPTESVQGFSNIATVTVAAMFILSSALLKTGFVGSLVPRMSVLFRFNPKFGMGIMMSIVAVMSAFINNTPIVAIFIPLVIKASARARLNPIKFLIPLSYASMFGGVCTLIGTSTNVLVSGMAVQSGIEPLKMFQMTPVGLIFLVTGLFYMVMFGGRLLPQRSYKANFTDRFNMRMYLAEIVILPGSVFVDKTIKESALIDQLDITIISIQRNGQFLEMPSENLVLRANDVVKIHCDTEKIKELKEEIGIRLTSDDHLDDHDISGEQMSLAEILIGRNQHLKGKTIKEIGFKNSYGAVVLAIKHRGEILHEKLNRVKLRTGDILLVEVGKDRLEDFKKLEATDQLPFSLLTEIGLPAIKKHKIVTVVSVLAGVVLLATFEVFSIMIASIMGVIILVLSRCLSLEEAYEAVEWKVIFLLAGAISLGVAMDKSGVALMISEFIVNNFGQLGPVAIVSALYLTTSLLTEFMSNNASAALLVPVALSIAESMGLSPVPFLMSITFAASTSFMTPIGYQTNTMVYSAGQYRFGDFVKVGAPLNLIFWIIASLIIPIFYPF
jgi:di/tricarboxylate transporter